jgi:hypothetical protein
MGIDITNWITEAIQSSNILVLAVFITGLIVINLPKIVEFVEGRRKVRISRLTEASKCEYLDENFKAFLSDEIQREYFRYVTKISAEKQYRDKLFEVHRNSENLPFIHFRRAFSYLNIKDGVLSVKISIWAKLIGWVNFIVGVLCGFLSLAMLMIPVYIKPIEPARLLSLYAGGGYFLVMSIIFLSLTLPVYSAKRIKSEIENQKPR